MERERKAAIALELEREEERLKEKKSLQEILREQMMEFKERQEEVCIFNFNLLHVYVFHLHLTVYGPKHY